MVKREVSILESASAERAGVSYFIEGKGMPATAKKFVDEAFAFFETLADNRKEYRKCKYKRWRVLDYHCITYKKFVVAFISTEREIIICDFVPSGLLAE